MCNWLINEICVTLDAVDFRFLAAICTVSSLSWSPAPSISRALTVISNSLRWNVGASRNYSRKSFSFVHTFIYAWRCMNLLHQRSSSQITYFCFNHWTEDTWKILTRVTNSDKSFSYLLCSPFYLSKIARWHLFPRKNTSGFTEFQR